MCYSRRKSTQFCNIYIANIGLFTVQTIITVSYTHLTLPTKLEV